MLMKDKIIFLIAFEHIWIFLKETITFLYSILTQKKKGTLILFSNSKVSYLWENILIFSTYIRSRSFGLKLERVGSIGIYIRWCFWFLLNLVDAAKKPFQFDSRETLQESMETSDSHHIS